MLNDEVFWYRAYAVKVNEDQSPWTSKWTNDRSRAETAARAWFREDGVEHTGIQIVGGVPENLQITGYTHQVDRP